MGIHNKKVIKSERKIKRKNKNLLADKILAYNPELLEGIGVYKDASRNFIFLIFLGALLIDFPIISVPCCILSMFFIIRMLQFIKYKSINNIVNEIAKDLSFKGIYNKGKVDDMLNDFKVKYGEDIVEYNQLVSMLEKYEALVMNIEFALKNITFRDKVKKDNKEELIINDNEITFFENDNDIDCEIYNRDEYKNKRANNYYRSFNEKFSVLYKNGDREIKRVNKAIEFFDDGDNENTNESAVVLKNVNKENKNLTVYLYKKSSSLQKNVL
ncbi:MULTISPECIES: hypothetical protein [Clostridium]|uniref:Uncharacterized protein n=1 Tax=Clostridium beijerinckii TaxID=1520 RepID=A0A1S9NA68_CLOBE|nr:MULTISPECIES: hypothetical protein [Clostridium]MBN7572718.1 hypothetical protein [Clostridium beijerinckii]MBN7578058.1 hypothetical protein [Clostridium beijerinckii]MBN7582491.1 hypothetical protein [Clostridium beijerinckii]MBO0519619.1 hypothetical protein [Clostridium beijerinckii]MZK48928.1 hypothetical protein [Clostridium beijerinckii]